MRAEEGRKRGHWKDIRGTEGGEGGREGGKRGGREGMTARRRSEGAFFWLAGVTMVTEQGSDVIMP